MRRFYSSALAGAILLAGGTSVKADINYFLNNDSTSPELFKFDSSSSTFEKISTFDKAGNNNVNFDNASYWHDKSVNKLYFQEKASNGSYTGRHWVYDIAANTWEAVTLTSETSDSEPFYFPISSSYSSDISTNTSNITTNTNNINKLGEGVAGSTALSAALTALPQVSKESKVSCGVGSGAYSSRYALGFGCASKVNERVDLNAGGSFVFGGSRNYGGGTLDDTAFKAGFVFKLGEINKPTLISMNDKKAIQAEVKTLKGENQELKDLIALQNQNHQDEMAIQKARLEKIERIALANQSNQKTATSFFNISNLFSTMRSFLISSN